MVEIRLRLRNAYHKALADDRWVARLQEFVAGRIRQAGVYASEKGVGTLRSDYNEDRFMGPQSVVKHRFRVHVNVARGEGDEDRDLYGAVVDYDPESGTFSCASETVDTVEGRRRCAARAEVEEALAALAGADSGEKFRKLRCPYCGGPLRAEYYPQGSAWSYVCAGAPEHFHSAWRDADLDSYGWLGGHLVNRTCPRCRSEEEVVGIRYGLLTDRDAIDRRTWVAGGCCVSPEKWLCRRCRWAFGNGSPGSSWA